ncbi:MAG: alginate export family protein, partial [Alteraurantiacibacter sp.]|nr:alginate export family protein [Alteraurantiacibacter sp.]
AVFGRTFDSGWKPRLSGVLGYASGDRDPTDDVQQRFDRLFGSSRPWSRNLYFTWQNVITPQARLEFQPHEKLRIDGDYSAFWLASPTDWWVAAHRRDPSGQSGTFVGQELDVRLRHALTRRLDLTLGYAHFIPGEFTKKTGRGDDTDFLYVEVTGRLIK